MENFTSEAKQVLSLAAEDAKSRWHSHVGTEHILIGLLKLGTGEAFKVLTQNQSLNAWYLSINRELRNGPAWVNQISYTPRTKKVLNLAHKEAEVVGSALIAPEHILLALVREGDGLAAKVMRDMGVATLEELRVALFGPRPASVQEGDQRKLLGRLNTLPHLILLLGLTPRDFEKMSEMWADEVMLATIHFATVRHIALVVEARPSLISEHRSELANALRSALSVTTFNDLRMQIERLLKTVEG